MTSPRMRAGTADRQAAVDGLTRHFTEGRLDPGEFDERVGKAYAATYLDELPELFGDLPEAQPRRGTGSGARPDPDGVLPYAPVPPPGPWSGPPRPPIHRPPRLLAVPAVLALIFLGSAGSAAAQAITNLQQLTQALNSQQRVSRDVQLEVTVYAASRPHPRSSQFCLNEFRHIRSGAGANGAD